MLRLLTVEKDFLSIDSAMTRYDAPRPLDMGKLESRFSISSVPSTRSSGSRFSSDSRISSGRSSTTSYSSDYSYQSTFFAPAEAPTLTKRPWDSGRSKRVVQLKRRSPPPSIKSGYYFNSLPTEVYDCILVQLKVLYADEKSECCLSCYMKDLYNLSLTSRTWDRATRAHLYGDIWLSAEDFQEIHRRKRLPSRVKLLRRTLRKRAPIAKFVKVLNLHCLRDVYDNSPENEKEELLNTVASLVMACPNLEALRGFHPPTDHHFDRLCHALSTRKRLKERVYMLNDEKPRLARERRTEQSQILFYQYENPTEMFLQQSDYWLSLETLFLQGQRPGCMNFRSFVASFRKLPSLKHLVISSFDAEDFNDKTLQALPKLVSLRLQNLPGLTDKGILRFSDSKSASTIQNLALIDLEITYLYIIRHFFTNLTALRRFTFHQGSSPCLMPGAVLPKPIFASDTLEYLHWDVLISGVIHDDLADSIFVGAFPALRAVRCPSDHDGALQDLCRPLAQAALDADYHLLARVDSPVGDVSMTHYERSLPAARRAAQRRIDEARKKPYMRVVVEEESMVKDVLTMKNFMGALLSRIDYCLEPDVEGSEEALASVRELVRGAPMPAGMGMKSCRRAEAGGNGSGSGWHGAGLRRPEVSLGVFF